MPRTFSSTALIALPLLLEHVEVGAEDLHRERALEAGLGLVDRVFGRLGVVEGDAGEGLQLLVDRGDQLRLGADRAAPLRIGLQSDVEFGVEEAGRRRCRRRAGRARRRRS